VYNTNINRKERNDIMYYVYEWFIKETNEIIYVGKGSNKRYRVRKHNQFFNEMIKRFECDSRIIKTFDNEKDAFDYEFERINEMWEKGQCVCNIYRGGLGGTTNWWSEEKRQWYSEHNCMKSSEQRKRMSINNPMKNEEHKNKMINTKSKKIVINEKVYNNINEVSKTYNKTKTAIYTWIKNGETVNGEIIHYLNEAPKTKIKKGYFTKQVLVDDILFNSVKEASQYLNVDPSILIKRMKTNKLYKGHKCQYANQQPSHEKSIL
jgi:hypothetical protein